jgi:hypothetical protein
VSEELATRGDDNQSRALVVASRVDLAEHAELLATHKKCAQNEAFWKKEKERAAERLQALMGESGTEGVIDGKEVLTYEYTDRMRTADFKKAHPDLYEAYTDEVTKLEFNVESFKRNRPDIYHEFQSRSLINKFSVL